MAYPQTTTTLMPAAFAGMDAGGPHVTDDGVNEEVSAELRAGIFVQRTSARGVKLFTAITQEPAGLTIHDHAKALPEQVGDTGVKPKCVMDVRSQGRGWVIVESAIVFGDQVHIRAIAGAGGSIIGACRKEAVGVELIDASGWAKWLGPSVTDADGTTLIAEVEFDIRNWRA